MPSAHSRTHQRPDASLAIRPARAVAVLAATVLLAPCSQAQDTLAGRNLAATCAPCHGTQGVSSGTMPSLAGMPADRIVTTLAGYKSGALNGTIMPQLARGYSDEQIALVAAWLAAQAPKTAAQP